MKLGEWLLKNHGKHEKEYTMVQTRMAKYQKTLASVDETIEQLVLHRHPLDEPARRGEPADPTYKAALLYEEVHSREKLEMELQYVELAREANKLKDYLDVFETIYENMDANDQWFVEKYYLRGHSTYAIAEMAFPDGKIYCKTSIQNIKQRIIEEVTETCKLLRFEPEDFRERKRRDGHAASGVRPQSRTATADTSGATQEPGDTSQ